MDRQHLYLGCSWWFPGSRQDMSFRLDSTDQHTLEAAYYELGVSGRGGV